MLGLTAGLRGSGFGVSVVLGCTLAYQTLLFVGSSCEP